MKTTIKKILARIMITSLFLIVVTINYNIASSYSFNFVGPNTANNGDTVTLTITGNGLTGKVNLSANNASLSNSSVWIEKNSVSVTAKITGFPATITANPSELTDNDYNIVSIVSKTITINEKVKPTPKPTQVPQNTPAPTQNPSTNPTSRPSATPSNQQTNPPPVTNNSQGTPQSKPNQTTTSSTTGKQSPGGENNFQTQVQNIENTTSSNNYLKTINVNKGNLSPDFDRENLEYNVANVEGEEIEIIAEAEDERATVSGTGTIALINGENTINITVTAENQSVRVYQLHIDKKQEGVQSELRLSTLEVKKINEDGNFYDIDIGFNKDKFEYVINLENDISDLDIIPIVEKEGVIVETQGKENLTEGENNIRITLSDIEDDTKTTVYNIKAIKAEKTIVEISTIPKKRNWIWLIIVIIMLIGIIYGIIYWRKNRKKIK